MKSGESILARTICESIQTTFISGGGCTRQRFGLQEVSLVRFSQIFTTCGRDSLTLARVLHQMLLIFMKPFVLEWMCLTPLNALNSLGLLLRSFGLRGSSTS